MISRQPHAFPPVPCHAGPENPAQPAKTKTPAKRRAFGITWESAQAMPPSIRRRASRA